MTKEQAIERFTQDVKEIEFEITNAVHAPGKWSVFAVDDMGIPISKSYYYSIYLLMWQEAMSQIGEDYPGEETKCDGRITVQFNDFRMHFYDDKEIAYSSNFNELNLFKLYKIWNDHEKIF